MKGLLTKVFAGVALRGDGKSESEFTNKYEVAAEEICTPKFRPVTFSMQRISNEDFRQADCLFGFFSMHPVRIL